MDDILAVLGLLGYLCTAPTVQAAEQLPYRGITQVIEGQVVITLREGMDPTQHKETLIHEMVHACQVQKGDNHPEEFARRERDAQETTRRALELLEMHMDARRKLGCHGACPYSPGAWK